MSSHWLTRWLRRTSVGSLPMGRRKRRLVLETLEDRTVPTTMFAVTSANDLLTFDSVTPGTIASNVGIAGLQAGEQIQGIDVRPATGGLYGLGITDDGGTRTGRIYRIDPVTAVATQVGAAPWSTTLADTAFWGFDFNPNVDLMRVISTNGDNFRVNPNTGVLVGTDTTLSEAGIDAVAYTNNAGFVATTTLYAIRFSDDRLKTIGGLNGSPSPNLGQVIDIGATGFSSGGAPNFDIEAGTNIARASFIDNADATTKLFTINLTTGAATVVGAIGGGTTPLRGLTTAQTAITVGGTANADSLVVTATGADSGSYSLNGGAAVLFSGITSFAFIGGGAADTLTINNPVGGLFAPLGGIFYHGGGQVGDTLNNLGGGNGGGAGSYTPSSATNGTIVHTQGALVQTINFTGLSPATDTVSEVSFTINGTAGTDTINVVNGPVAGQVQVNSGAVPTFELMNFANKTNVTIDAQGGADIATVNVTANATGLVNLNIDTGALADTVSVQATVAGLITSIDAGAGNDTITIGSAAGSLDSIGGRVNVNGGANDAAPTTSLCAGVDTNTLATGHTVNNNDSGDADNNTYSLTITDLTRNAQFLVFFNAAETINFDAGAGNDTIDVDAKTNVNTFVSGNAGNDTVTLNSGSTANLGVDGDTGTDTITVTANGSGSVTNLFGGANNDTFNIIAAGGSLDNLSSVISIDGGANDAAPTTSLSAGVVTNTLATGDTLNINDSGDADNNIYTLSVTDLIRNALSFVFFTAAESVTLNAGFGNDDITIDARTGATTTVNGGVGNDAMSLNVGFTANAVLNGGDGTDGMTLFGSGASSVAILNGGANNDTFSIVPVGGSLDNIGGAATVNGDANDAAPTSSFTTGTVVNTLAVGDTLIFNDAADGSNNTYTLDAGSLVRTGMGTVSFFTVDTVALNAGIGANTIGVTATNSVTTTILNGNSAIDAFSISNTGAAASVQVNGADAADVVNVFATAAGGVTELNGGPGGDDFNVGPAGSAANPIQGAVGVKGEAGADTLSFGVGVSLAGGTFDGGTEIDELDYSDYTTPVAVNLGLSSNGLNATLQGTQQAPVASSIAAGTATITNYNAFSKTFDLSVTVTDLAPADITGFHIHRGVVGTNGPIIIDLQALGAPVPAGTGFTFTAVGVSLATSLDGGAANEAAFLGGITYLNIHTAAAPGGLIRGQIFTSANVNLAAGTATGTAGISNVENAQGGSGNDGLVGSFAANILDGLAGNDILVGAPGADSVFGGANDDVVVWSNGDNNDLMDGEAGADIVQINGNVNNGDVFTIGANGARVAFARTSAGPFALDIGTTERLIVNGIGGDDNTSVNSLTGVLDLAQIDLNGFAGNDTFNVIPSSTATVNVAGFEDTAGDTLNLDPTGTTNRILTVTAATGVNAVAGTFASDRQPVNFRNIEAGLDTTAPTITTIDDGDTDNVVLVGATLTYIVTFSEAIDATTVSAADFNNSGTAAITVGTITGGPTVFTIPITATSSGTLVLRIPTGAVIRDIIGNALAVPVLDGDTVVVNGAPTDIGLSPASVAEAAGANAVVGTLSAVDPNVGDTFTFSLVPGAVDNASFNISGNTLRATNSLSVANGATRSVRVQVVDSAGNTFQKTLTVTVTPQPQQLWPSQATLEPVTATFVAGNAKANYVRDLYAKILGRQGAANEVAGWVDLLNAGISEAAVVEAIFNSPERRLSQAQSFYTRLLGRAGSPAEVQAVAGALASGVKERDMIVGFLLSAEFQAGKTDTQFVNSLYTTLLSRSGDAQGVSEWVTILANGAPRQFVVLGFLLSVEFGTREITGYYAGYLGRAADQPALNGWLGALQSNTFSDVAIAKFFLSSGEFINKPR